MRTKSAPATASPAMRGPCPCARGQGRSAKRAGPHRKEWPFSLSVAPSARPPSTVQICANRQEDNRMRRDSRPSGSSSPRLRRPGADEHIAIPEGAVSALSRRSDPRAQIGLPTLAIGTIRRPAQSAEAGIGSSLHATLPLTRMVIPTSSELRDSEQDRPGWIGVFFPVGILGASRQRISHTVMPRPPCMSSRLGRRTV